MFHSTRAEAIVPCSLQQLVFFLRLPHDIVCVSVYVNNVIVIPRYEGDIIVITLVLGLASNSCNNNDIIWVYEV